MKWNMVLGSELSLEDQRYVLAAYVHRLERDDAKWLSTTGFSVNQNGMLDRRVKSCYSHWNRISEKELTSK